MTTEAADADTLAEAVLVAHQPTSTSACICGSFGGPQDLGRSHPAHVVKELHDAGLILSVDRR